MEREIDRARLFQLVEQKIDLELAKRQPVAEARKRICEILSELPGYDWVGFYVADRGKRLLKLDQFVGEPTEHVEIPFGRGICGQSAESCLTFLVPDVLAEENYLACSVHVKSEIVVPIFKEGDFVAQLDIDSHRKNNFDDRDKEFLEKVCGRISALF